MILNENGQELSLEDCLCICGYTPVGCLLCCEPVDIIGHEEAEEDLQIVVYEKRRGGTIKHEFNFVKGEKLIFENRFAQGVEVKLKFIFDEQVYAVKFINEICYG